MKILFSSHICHLEIWETAISRNMQLVWKIMMHGSTALLKPGEHWFDYASYLLFLTYFDYIELCFNLFFYLWFLSFRHVKYIYHLSHYIQVSDFEFSYSGMPLIHLVLQSYVKTFNSSHPVLFSDFSSSKKAIFSKP